MNVKRIVIMTAAVGVCTAVMAGKPKKEVFIPMDYSTCGYHASEMPIPDVKNVVTVQADGNDASARLQRAIDYVASLKADKNGRRGTVLIGEGTFHLSRPLRISASGIVLRGMGRGKTILIKEGYDRGAAIYIEGQSQWTKGDTIKVSQNVKAGSTQITLSAGANLKAGDRIQILRPSTKEWIESLNCNDYGGGLDYTGWKPGDIDMKWNRTVVAASAGSVTLDAPITAAIDGKFGGAMLITTYNKGEISECGVENMSIASAHNDWNAKDEDHCWDGVWMNNAHDCWVRRISFSHLAGSAVNLQKQTRRVTVEDCVAAEPVSEVGGWRRMVFLTRGEQNLIQRCVSKDGYHDFAADYCAAGPNAFVQCDAEGALSFSGSVGSWATGLLFDIVNIEGNDLTFRNLENWQMGTGWNTANSMFWQCTASTIYCYSPDADNRCSANACWGTMTGNGEWTGSNNACSPRSLFYDQLQKRAGDKAVNGYVYDRDVNATSSPTIELAQQLAQQSLKEPRVTIEMWQDSVPYTASLSAAGLKDIDKIKFKGQSASASAADSKQNDMAFAVTGGKLTADGRLIVGNRFATPWWNGRTKESFTEKSAKPAVTRFVPGREGTGWTDRVDSVAAFLKANNYCMFDQHYGLWYDLRRIDHERVKRADGEVSAPFYEQPFARSGQGTCWDGLSKYDLTKPDQWYWQRLREFAASGAKQGILLFNENYFQHNIIEAGAHWVDAPWRTANNINSTSFPEPVPFAGDKRVFMAEQFYNETDPALRPLHKGYIRMCLDQLKDNGNVVQLVSEEYTGPLHFTRFWLETIAEWEKETGRHPMIALSCTKDAQDSILADPTLSKVVDIIDIRYWHYNTDSLWAPPAGKNMAMRQFMRKMKVGKTGYTEAYRAVREYTAAWPDKAVTFFAQQYPQYGWAILMAGGSLPNIPVKGNKFLADVSKMKALSGDGGKTSGMADVLGSSEVGYVVYSHGKTAQSLNVAPGNYCVRTINKDNGTMTTVAKKAAVSGSYTLPNAKDGQVYWLEKL